MLSYIGAIRTTYFIAPRERPLHHLLINLRNVMVVVIICVIVKTLFIYRNKLHVR